MYNVIMEISKVIIDDVYPPPRAIHTASFWTSKCRTTANCRDAALLSRDTTVLLQLL